MNRILEFFDNARYYMRRCLPRYRGYPFYKKQFWKLLKDRITKGYDESVTWSLYYYTAKWIYPRLILFYDSIDKVGAIPSEYVENRTTYYLSHGYKYDKHYHRLEDREADKQVYKEAKEQWKEDVWKMCEAFRDILDEDDNWEQWTKGWEFYQKPVQKYYEKIKTNEARKKYWNSFGFKRQWDPKIQFTINDFSERKRDEGLKLFTQHFMELWN